MCLLMAEPEKRPQRYGVYWCIMVYNGYMGTAKTARKFVRRSISLRPEMDTKIQALVRRERRSVNQVLEELVKAGLETREAEKRRFFELADRLAVATDPKEQQRIKEELARMTFGA
jgi:hypothetical protein